MKKRKKFQKIKNGKKNLKQRKIKTEKGTTNQEKTKKSLKIQKIKTKKSGIPK